MKPDASRQERGYAAMNGMGSSPPDRMLAANTSRTKRGSWLQPCLAILLLASPAVAQTETVLSTNDLLISSNQPVSVENLLTPTIRSHNFAIGLKLDGINAIAATTTNGFDVFAAVGNQATGVAAGTWYSGLGNPLISGQGHMAFSGFLTGPADQNNGIWFGMGQTQAMVAREGHQAPDAPAGALIASLKNPVLNDQGELAFIGFMRSGVGGVDEGNDGGLWAGAAGSPVLVAREGDTAPGTEAGEMFCSVWGSPSLNKLGHVAFRNSLIPGSGGATLANDEGIWSGTAGALTLLGREGMQAPDMAQGILFNHSGPTTTFSNPAINDADTVAFVGWLDGPGIDASNNHAIWSGQPDALQVAVQTGDIAAGTSGQFGRILTPSINADGRILFRAILTTGGSVTAANDRGIWSGLPGALALIAREGDQAPDAPAGAMFADFSSSGTNALGQIAFEGSLLHGSGGVSAANDGGLWISDPDGLEFLKVAREGDALAGSTITALAFAGGSGGQDGRRSGLNDDGQMAYTASLANGAHLLQLFTPVLRWRALASGHWDQRFNWTLATRPGMVHDVLIDTTVPVTVAGPAAATTFIKSLAVGGGGAAARLNLHQGDLAVSRTLTVRSDGTIDLALTSLQVEGVAANEGTLFIGAGALLKNEAGLLNSGLIDLNGGAITGNGVVTNAVGGIIVGGSSVTSPLTNAGGLIHATGTRLELDRFNGGNSVEGELRIDDGSELRISADTAYWFNWGHVMLDGPGAMLSGQVAINVGVIEGIGEVRNRLDNRGIVRATSGLLALTGPGVENKPGAELIVMDGATLRVSNDFSNDGSVTLQGGVFEHLAGSTWNLVDVGGYGQFIGNHWTNDGMMHFSGGSSSIDGEVTNTATGSLIVSSATATFNHRVTSAGVIENNEGDLHFLGGLTLNNLLTTDPAETFFTDLIVGGNGVIQADSGDRFWVAGDFENASHLAALWDTSQADLIFHDGPSHLLEVAGLDQGPNDIGYLDNFAWGTLELETGAGLALLATSVGGEQVDIALGGDPGFDANPFSDDLSGHALYVTNLLLQDGIAQIDSIDSDGTIIYYDPASELNRYLEGDIYALEGGGYVIPIGFEPPVVPTPLAFSSATAIFFLGAFLRWRRYRA